MKRKSRKQDRTHRPANEQEQQQDQGQAQLGTSAWALQQQGGMGNQAVLDAIRDEQGQQGGPGSDGGDGGFESADPGESAKAGFSGAGGDIPHRTQMEESFGQDLGGIQAHTGPDAAAAAESMDAKAFAQGEHIAFADAQPEPGLVAHEVAHTLQQGAPGLPVQQKPKVSKPGDPAEQEADAVQNAFEQGGPAQVQQQAPSDTIHRTPDDQAGGAGQEGPAQEGAAQGGDGEGEEGGGMARVPVSAGDFSWGDLEDSVEEAQEPAAAPEDLYSQYMSPTLIPLDHSETLLGKCDEEIQRTQDAMDWANRHDRSNHAQQLASELEARRGGKQLIQDDRNSMVAVNSNINVVLTALGLVRDSDRYVTQLFGSLSSRLGEATVQDFLANPIPDHLVQQYDQNVQTPPTSSESLSAPLLGDGSEDSQTGTPSTLAGSASGITEKRLSLLAACERQKAAASQWEAALAGKEEDRALAAKAKFESAKSGFGTAVSLLKGAIDLASGNWVGPVIDAVSGIVGAITDYHAGIEAARATRARDQMLDSLIASATQSWDAERTQMEALGEGLRSAATNYSSSERDIVERRDGRRDQMQALAAEAGNVDSDSDAGEAGARIMLAAAIIEAYTMAQGLQASLDQTGLSTEGMLGTVAELRDHRENNPCRYLKYTWRPEDFDEGELQILGAWSWVHPGETAALSSLADTTSFAEVVAEQFVTSLGPTAEQALGQLRDIMSDQQFEY